MHQIQVEYQKGDNSVTAILYVVLPAEDVMSQQKRGIDMRKILKMLALITSALFEEVKYFLMINLRYFAGLIEVATPYIMYYIGQQMALDRGRFAVGGEIFIPIVIMFITYYFRQIANRSNKGGALPKPERRFTIVDPDTGEVNIETARTEELILYMADLEDWMERRKLL